MVSVVRFSSLASVIVLLSPGLSSGSPYPIYKYLYTTMPVAAFSPWDIPEMDGELSDWDLLPGYAWIDLHSHITEYPWLYAHTDYPDYLPFFHKVSQHGRVPEYLQPGPEHDPEDLSVEITVAWSDDFNRLYFAQRRGDDYFGTEAMWQNQCGSGDGIAIRIDADHSGGSGNMDTQVSTFVWPPARLWESDEDRWHYIRGSGGAWNQKEPYACCDDSYVLDDTFNTLTSEWWIVPSNQVLGRSEPGELADLSEGMVIGMSITICDQDEDGFDDWSTIGADGFADGFYHPPEDNEYLLDWTLIPEEWMYDVYPVTDPDDVGEGWESSVKRSSWGHIKASFQ